MKILLFFHVISHSIFLSYSHCQHVLKHSNTCLNQINVLSFMHFCFSNVQRRDKVCRLRSFVVYNFFVLQNKVVQSVFINKFILRVYHASFITPIVMQNNAHNYEFATYQSIWATNKLLQAQFGQTNISRNRESPRNLQTKGHCSAFELNFLL